MIDWRRQASCRGLDPLLFLVTDRNPENPIRELCATCGVAVECRADALAQRLSDVQTFQAGMTPREIKREIRRTRTSNSPVRVKW